MSRLSGLVPPCPGLRQQGSAAAGGVLVYGWTLSELLLVKEVHFLFCFNFFWNGFGQLIF